MATAYEMEMIFSASVGLKCINDFLRQVGDDGTYMIKDAISISIKQICRRIPDEDYIRQVAEILKTNYATRDINLTECHFTGYKYIREIEVEDDDA